MVTVSAQLIDSDPQNPLLVLGNPLGTSSLVWASVAHRMADDYRVLMVDLPGHGLSPQPTEEFTLADVAAGILAAVDEVGDETFLYAGGSISGAIGLELALAAPERVRALAACCTADYFGGPDNWGDRIAAVEADGTRSLVEDTGDRWFAAGFLTEDYAAGHMMLEDMARCDDASYIACCRALASYDLRGRLADITVPTLFLAGAQDITTTPEDHVRMAGEVTQATAEAKSIPDSAHLFMAEHPDLVVDALTDFFTRTAGGRA